MHRSLKGTLETILVVDNDQAVRKAVVSILKRANFRVLSADSGVDAINLAEETAGEIHLLLSEVDVPQMSGPDLGQALKMTRPDIHVMLMSGQEHGRVLPDELADLRVAPRTNSTARDLKQPPFRFALHKNVAVAKCHEAWAVKDRSLKYPASSSWRSRLSLAHRDELP